VTDPTGLWGISDAFSTAKQWSEYGFVGGALVGCGAGGVVGALGGGIFGVLPAVPGAIVGCLVTGAAVGGLAATGGAVVGFFAGLF